MIWNIYFDVIKFNFQGVFLFRNGFKKGKANKKKGGKVLFEKIFMKEPWYETYKQNWNSIENELQASCILP